MGDIGRELTAHTVVVRQHRHLALELLALRLNALEHGNHLGISMLVAAARMVQIDLLQRLNDGTGLTTRQEKREHRTRRRNKQHRRHERHQNRRNARLGLRQANNLAVVKSDGSVQHNLVERGACALRRTRAALESLGDLGTIAVIGQHGRRRLVVVGNRPVFVDQRDAQVLAIETAQKGNRLLLLIEGSGNKLGFLRKVGTRGICQGILHKERTQHRKRHDNRHSAEKNRREHAMRQGAFSLGS